VFPRILVLTSGYLTKLIVIPTTTAPRIITIKSPKFIYITLTHSLAKNGFTPILLIGSETPRARQEWNFEVTFIVSYATHGYGHGHDDGDSRVDLRA
jgi:hypothetical protein